MRKAQTMLEYAILLAIIVAALIVMQVYLKRGIQGRWKQSIDDMGEQYDSDAFEGYVRHTSNTTAESRMMAIHGVSYNGRNGMITWREDTMVTQERRVGNSYFDPGQL